MDVYIHTYIYIGLDNVKRISDKVPDPLDALTQGPDKNNEIKADLNTIYLPDKTYIQVLYVCLYIYICIHVYICIHNIDIYKILFTYHYIILLYNIIMTMCL
jgi:hypothetical protein